MLLILEKLRKRLPVHPHRDIRVTCNRVSFNSSQNFGDGHEIRIGTKLYQVVVELLVPGMNDFEPVRWQTVWKVGNPSDKIKKASGKTSLEIGKGNSLILQSDVLEKLSHHASELLCFLAADCLVDQVCVLPLNVSSWFCILPSMLISESRGGAMQDYLLKSFFACSSTGAVSFSFKLLAHIRKCTTSYCPTRFDGGSINESITPKVTFSGQRCLAGNWPSLRS